MGVNRGVEKCRKVSNHVENRFHAKSWLDTLRLGLVFRRLRKNDKLKHVATARPLLLQGAERGVSIRRGHPILCRPTNLCQESIPAHRHPGPLTLGQDSQDTSLSEGLLWAVTPKLTMIAGRQLSIGALPVRSSLLDSTLTRENSPPFIGSLYMVVNRETIFFI